MAKGIRVNQLAKDLGVESKAILEKCRAEGLDGVTNHQSTVSLGLAETIKEWFSSAHGGGTAIETAAPVDVMTKPKTAKRSSRKKVSTLDGEIDSSDSAEAEHFTPKAELPEAPEAEELVSQPIPSLGSEPEPITNVTPPASEAEVVEEVVEAPAKAPPVLQVLPTAPVVAPPVTTPSAPPAVAAHAKPPTPGHGEKPLLRETVTLSSRGGVGGHATVIRKPVQVAPQLTSLEPAKISGPKIVRVEKPDVVPTPRRRGPIEQTTPGTGYTTARPTTGRGVKVDDDEEEAKKKAAKSGKSLSTRRRGADGRRGEADEKLREFSEQDLKDRSERIHAASVTRAAFDRHLEKTSARGTHQIAKTAVQMGEPVAIEEPITVKSLSATLGIKSNEILKKLISQGIFANVNQALDTATASTIALDYGVELQIRKEASMEDDLHDEFEVRASKSENRVTRPPVVTILGHVDHGKTSLLDKIRSADVAAGEAGGITQHTAAWMVTVGEGEARKKVTFIDTPGHQAFTSMRARGANMTDVVVLVVSAAEGVQPQTIESINHARAAGVPIVVAMNKIDRADANDQKVLGELAGQNLNPTEWGGDIEVIRTSAQTGQGIKELIEILDYQSELLQLKSDPEVPARGTVIESRVDPGLGSVATVLVQDGTLKIGDVMLAGPGHGRIRSLWDDQGKSIQQATASMPVIVSGLDSLPAAGDKFFIVENLDRARSIAGERSIQARQTQLAQMTRVTADNLLETISAGDAQTINLIIKADVQGSVETLVKTVTDQNTTEVKVRVIHSGVGGVTESDVQLAMATKTKPTDNRVAIIGFHVVPDDAARILAEQNHVDVKTYRVIYEIFDDLKKALSGMLTPEEREKMHGHAEIRQVYKFSKIGSIAGCFITDGHIQRGSKIRLIRDGKIITEDLSIETLRRVKEDVKEVKNGFECGIKLANYDDIKIGDRFEAYVRETFQRTL